MSRRLTLTAVMLLALVSSSAAVPRMRICTARGVAQNPTKIYFGGGEIFYAGFVDPDDPATRFGPQNALRDVEWRMFRTQDLGGGLPLRDGQLRREVAHREPPRRSWGGPVEPFGVPDHLDAHWSAGRYLIRAKHPVHGEARLRVTVATIVLLGLETRHEANSYRASFHVAIADPDLREPRVPLEIVIVTAAGQAVDCSGGARLVRDRLAHVSPRPIRLSSTVTTEAAGKRLAGTGDTWPILRVVPDSKLRVIVGDRVFEFLLPLEEGLLVHKNGRIPFGREGAVRARTGLPSSDPGGKAVRPPAGGPGEKNLEIVSDAGSGRRLKIWMGESATFAARLRPRGLDDLFRPNDWLRDVFWTLRRVSIPVDRRAIAIIPGTSIAEVGRVDPTGRWGAPAAVFVCPDDVHGSWKPGLYVLRAERQGSATVEVRLDVAAFELTEVETDLRAGHYVMTLRFRLTDPFETRDRVPIAVRVIGARDEVHDEIRGVVLSRDLARRDEFLSIRVRLSSRVRRPCKDRDEGKDPLRLASQPGILKVVPGSRLRIVLDDAVFTYPLPLSIYEVLTGRSGASDRPAGE